MNKIVTWAEKYLFPPIKILHIIGYFVLFALMFLTVGDVIGRKLSGSVSFMSPIPGTFELTEFALIIIVFFSLGYTQVKGEHISIDIITSKFPKRGQAILDSIMSLLSLVMFGLVAWQGIVYAGRLIEGQNISGVLSIPQAPFAFVVAAGSIVYCLAMLVALLNNLSKAVKHVA
jgi:TRAP-type C4-dicarboxylate transport system permease small subunit